jgi:hypothetical protein
MLLHLMRWWRLAVCWWAGLKGQNNEQGHGKDRGDQDWMAKCLCTQDVMFNAVFDVYGRWYWLTVRLVGRPQGKKRKKEERKAIGEPGLPDGECCVVHKVVPRLSGCMGCI